MDSRESGVSEIGARWLYLGSEKFSYTGWETAEKSSHGPSVCVCFTRALSYWGSVWTVTCFYHPKLDGYGVGPVILKVPQREGHIIFLEFPAPTDCGIMQTTCCGLSRVTLANCLQSSCNFWHFSKRNSQWVLLVLSWTALHLSYFCQQWWHCPLYLKCEILSEYRWRWNT